MTAPASVASADLDENEAAERFVQSVAGAKQLPAFVRNVRSIATVASDLQVRVALLEKEILRDPSLTSRVLRVASATSRGSRIANVKQAIILLGYDRVTNLSASAALFDKLERNSDAVQDLLVLAVLAANQGLAVAAEARHGRPELAYLCGLFSNLGEVMAACYRKTQYMAWAERRGVGSGRPDGREAEHFGFSFEKVAVLLAREWGLPPEVIRSLRRQKVTKESPADRLLLITQFSAEHTRALYSLPPSAPENPAVEALLDQYCAPLRLDRKAIAAAMKEARLESGPALKQMNLSLDAWHRARVRSSVARLAALGPGHDAASGDDSATTAPLTPRGHGASAGHAPSARAGTTFTEAVRASLAAGLAAGYDRGVVALSNEAFTGVRGRLGTGDGHEALLDAFDVATGSMLTPLGAALDHRADLFLDLQSAVALPYRSDPVLRTLQPRCVALLPLVLSEKLIGCLYFDSAQAVTSDDEGLHHLHAARERLAATFLGQNDAAAAMS